MVHSLQRIFYLVTQFIQKLNVPGDVFKNQHVSVTTTGLNQINMQKTVNLAIKLRIEIIIKMAEIGPFIKI